MLLTNPSIVYSIIINSKALISHMVNIFTQFDDELPWISSEFSVQVYKSDLSNMISLSNRLYRVHYLPAPYDTSCDPDIEPLGCFNKCILQVLSRYNRISYGSTEDRRLDMRFLSYSDLVNGSVNEMLRQTELFCDKKCRKTECEYGFTSTIIEDEIPVDNLRNVLAVDFPSHPTVEMKTVPVMTLYQFIYELLCCCSFWLGVSFIDLKPSSSSMRRKMKIRVYFTQMYLVVDKALNTLLQLSFWSSCLRKMHQLSKRKLLNLFFCSLTMGLCVSHITHSMVTYMSYSSFIDVYETMETRTDLNLHICLDMAELIGRKFPTHLEDPVLARSVIMNRTVTSLFADTPREDDLIQQCGYRGLHSRMANLSQLGHVTDRILFSTKNKTICHQVYEVRKFIVQSYMCYSIWPRYLTGWNQFQMKHALNKHKTILEVSVKSFLLTKRFTFIVADEKFFPLTSSMFATNIIRNSKHDQYKVSYVKYIENILPTPKMTDGFVPSVFDRCLNRCVNQKFATFNLTLSKRFTGPSNLRFVSYLDRKSNTLNIPFKQIQIKCEMSCLEYNDQILLEDEDDFKLFVPIVQAGRSGKSKGKLTTISLESTNQPVLIITFKLKISFFQQIINLGSILGLWFGFSAVSLARMGRIRDKQIDHEELLSLQQRTWRLKRKYNIR